MVTTIQRDYTVRKYSSLVLNGKTADHEDMTTTTRTPLNRRLRASLRHAWSDQVKAQRALLRLTPYDDYLQHRR